MENFSIKKIISFAVMMIMWLCPIVPRYVKISTAVLLFSLMLCITIILMVKSSAISLSVTAVAVLVPGIYDFNFIAAYLPALMLIIAHIYLSGSDKGKKDSAGVFITLSFIATVINFIYGFIRTVDTDETGFEIDSMLSLNTLWFFPVITVLIILAYEEEKGKKKKTDLKRIYTSAFIGLIASYCNYAINGPIYTMEEVRISFAGWFAFVIVICINDDPYLKSALSKAEELILNKKREQIKHSE